MIPRGSRPHATCAQAMVHFEDNFRGFVLSLLFNLGMAIPVILGNVMLFVSVRIPTCIVMTS